MLNDCVIQTFAVIIIPRSGDITELVECLLTVCGVTAGGAAAPSARESATLAANNVASNLFFILFPPFSFSWFYHKIRIQAV